MQLLVLESTNDDPVVKSSVKGIGAVTTVTKTAASGADSRLGINRTVTNGLERTNTLEHTSSSNSVATMTSVHDFPPRTVIPMRDLCTLSESSTLAKRKCILCTHRVLRIGRIGVTRYLKRKPGMRRHYSSSMQNHSDYG